MKTDTCADLSPLPAKMTETQVVNAFHQDATVVACLRGEEMTWINWNEIREKGYAK